MTQPTFIYNLKSTPTGYAMAKLDEDYNIAAVYNLAPSRNGHFSCDCPANNRAVITKPCKHRRMLPLMLGAVNTDRFYNPETGVWCEPLGDMHRVEPEPELTAEVVGTPGKGEYRSVTIPDDAVVIDSLTSVADALLAAVEAPEGLVGEALGSSAEQTETHTVHYLTDEPPTKYTHHQMVDIPAPASASAPTIRRR